jgi:hypothetical protein
VRAEEFDWCFTEGLPYCHEHDLRTYAVCLRGSRAGALLRRGKLVETVALVEDTLREDVSLVNRLHLLIPLGVARLRLGDGRAAEALDEAWRLAVDTAEPGWLYPAAAALADAAGLDARITPDPRVLDLLAAPDPRDPWLDAGPAGADSGGRGVGAARGPPGHPGAPGRAYPARGGGLDPSAAGAAERRHRRAAVHL